MKINRNNYEVYIVDFFDGKLNASEIAELMLFLEKQPDIRSYFEDFQLIEISKEGNIAFPHKESLKKVLIIGNDVVTEENYQLFLFDAIEGNLDETDRGHLDKFLADNPTIVSEFNQLKKTVLHPEKVIFEPKAALKRTIVVPLYRRLVYAASVAAALVLFFAGYNLLNTTGHADDGDISIAEISGNWAVRSAPEKPDVFPQATKSNLAPQKSDNQSVARSGDQSLYRSEYAYMDTRNLRENALYSAEPVPVSMTEKYQTAHLELLAAIEERQKWMTAAENQEADKTWLQRLVAGLSRSEDRNAASPNEERMTFWNYAEMGIAGYNALAQNPLSFRRETDEQGKTKALALGRMEYSR
jgi:hypothetical protein